MLCKEEIKTLVDLLRNMETEIKYFENFFTSFTRTMMNLNNRARKYLDYSDIDVLFANSTEEAMKLIDLYGEKGYIFISYTQSMYHANSIDLYPHTYDTHHVIGQEYDKVMIMMIEILDMIQKEEYKEKNILILIYCFISYYIKRFLEQEKNYVC